LRKEKRPAVMPGAGISDRRQSVATTLLFLYRTQFLFEITLVVVLT
jgi:hypothetical protein